MLCRGGIKIEKYSQGGEKGAIVVKFEFLE